MTESYEAFLERKLQQHSGVGFEPVWMPEFLFPFQRVLVDWAIQMGRAGIFADCGLGKTPMLLTWAWNVHYYTRKPVLIVCPLAVSFQIEQEARKFGITDITVSRDGTVPAALTVTNYERLELFNPDHFGGVVCDESSAIKAFDGKRRAIVTEFMRTVPYRLLDTATAAPNDYIELGTSSEALGYLGHMDMLNKFFTNKQKTSGTGRFHGQAAQWRFKGWAEVPFWRWVSSWARAVRRPSDLGFDDNGFFLPELRHRSHVVKPPEGWEEAQVVGLREEREEQRATIVERCEETASVLSDAWPAVAWCQLNDEGKLLTKLIDGAVEVSGADSLNAKEEKLIAFTRGEIRVLVTKPKIGAFGLNWQHCNRMTFFPSHSYEQYYQAVRRCWRFGQQSPVTVDIITTPGGANVLANLERKAEQASRMFDALTAHMRDGMQISRDTSYDTKAEVPGWVTS